MYILFREKNWKPSDYWGMGAGEKKIVRVFLRQEAEERAKEAKSIRKKAAK